MTEKINPDSTNEDISVVLLKFGASEEAIVAIKGLGASTVEDLATLLEPDLIGAGMNVVSARKLIASLKPATPVVNSTVMNNVNFDGILPTVSDDSSWLNALKTGGVLKVDQSTIIAAIRAALANAVGLFDVPGRLSTAMEKFADLNDEQVDPTFFKLRKQLAQRSYAEVFEAIEGLDGNFVTDARKKQLFERINTYFLPAIIRFYEQLKSWQEAWTQGAMNPNMLMYALTAGKGGMTMPPGMMQPPDTNGLRDQAEAVNDAINRVFAGTGVQIASALAYDATRIKKTLEDNRLPAMVGAANRDQMLKQLNLAVSATYPRLEINLTKFVLACIQVKDLPSGEEELQYFGAMYMLGSQITWDQLGASSGITGIGGHKL